MRTTTTCFTLNAGRASAAASAETKTMMAPCDDPEGASGRPVAPSTLAHRVRGTSNRAPKPNAYACMKLLGHGSPDRDCHGGDPMGRCAAGALSLAGENLVYFSNDQFYGGSGSGGSDEIYATRNLARNETLSLPVRDENQRHHLTAHAHDLIKTGCCHYALAGRGQEFGAEAGNQLHGTSLRQAHEHEMALLCRDEAPYACAKHHVTLTATQDRSASDTCAECEQSRVKVMKDETNLF